MLNFQFHKLRGNRMEELAMNMYSTQFMQPKSEIHHSNQSVQNGACWENLIEVNCTDVEFVV